MMIAVSIAIQGFLLGLALLVIVLRCWVRLRFERATLTIIEYFVWIGWLFELGWFICSTIALRILLKHPAVGEELVVNNVAYLKTVFIGKYFFDIGIYWPKMSITTLYWLLIPRGFQTFRNALYASTVYLVCCLTAAFLLVTLITHPISNNWSIENQLESAWNSYTLFVVQWCLNFSTDLLLFCFPFFLLPHLKLRRGQKLGLVGIFSLGAMTLSISLARFIAYSVTDFGLEDAPGNTLITAEMTTALIVVCLPGLKKFMTRSETPIKTTDRGDGSESGPRQMFSNHVFKSRSTPEAYAECGVRDDEIELVDIDKRPHSLSTETLDG